MTLFSRDVLPFHHYTTGQLAHPLATDATAAPQVRAQASPVAGPSRQS